MMTVFIAMAELDDGNRSIDRAYLTHESAEKAAKNMIKELEEAKPEPDDKILLLKVIVQKGVLK